MTARMHTYTQTELYLRERMMRPPRSAPLTFCCLFPLFEPRYVGGSMKRRRRLHLRGERSCRMTTGRMPYPSETASYNCTSNSSPPSHLRLWPACEIEDVICVLSPSQSVRKRPAAEDCSPPPNAIMSQETGSQSQFVPNFCHLSSTVCFFLFLFPIRGSTSNFALFPLHFSCTTQKFLPSSCPQCIVVFVFSFSHSMCARIFFCGSFFVQLRFTFPF
jgi:hypothetical protein